MARIDLRNCTIYLKDGLTGTAKANKTLAPVVGSQLTMLVLLPAFGGCQRHFP